ncbi:unnamed protein product [Cyprideis torosa]|uniref:Uncharacterized protein n=1 Tax=Cyprideis torosa TaxID=163714 RepID=A0A7R8W9L4_9CRUS|nr:unnamed protein product [Cyprideis torosa]CAG0888653.1 unnamed protein product [Cyprideis torosa]
MQNIACILRGIWNKADLWLLLTPLLLLSGSALSEKPLLSGVNVVPSDSGVIKIVLQGTGLSENTSVALTKSASTESGICDIGNADDQFALSQEQNGTYYFELPAAADTRGKIANPGPNAIPVDHERIYFICLLHNDGSFYHQRRHINVRLPEMELPNKRRAVNMNVSNSSLSSTSDYDGALITGIRPHGSSVDFSSLTSTILEGDSFDLYVFGEKLQPGVGVRFTPEPRGQGESCEGLDTTHIFEISSETSTVGQVSVEHGLLLRGDGPMYLCLKDDSIPDATWIHMGTDPLVSFTLVQPLIPIYWSLIFVVVLLVLSGLFSGLNLGLMSLNELELRMIRNCGTDSEKKYAGLMAVLFSTVFIVIFGEIVPQAICTRHGLAVGAKTVHLTKFFMLITFPASFPISKILDKVLGEEMGAVYTRERIRELVKVADEYTTIAKDEANIISGALDLGRKSVGEVMTKLEDVFMLSIEAVLDFRTFSEIRKHGYSRIPVYDGNRNNVVSILYVKDLVCMDPDDNIPLKVICEFFNNELFYVFDDTKLDVMFRAFKEGNQGHLALVQHVNDKTDGDPFYEVVGIITLEDVLEEILQAEIVDETDFFWNQGHLALVQHVNDKTDGDPFYEVVGIITLEDVLEEILQAEIVDETDFFSVPAFQSSRISDRVLRQLLNHDVIFIFKIPPRPAVSVLPTDEALMDEKPVYFFIKGVPTDCFILILEGRVRVTTSTENLVFESGPFSYFGVQALLHEGDEVDPATTVPPSLTSPLSSSGLHHPVETSSVTTLPPNPPAHVVTFRDPRINGSTGSLRRASGQSVVKQRIASSGGDVIGDYITSESSSARGDFPRPPHQRKHWQLATSFGTVSEMAYSSEVVMYELNRRHPAGGNSSSCCVGNPRDNELQGKFSSGEKGTIAKQRPLVEDPTLEFVRELALKVKRGESKVGIEESMKEMDELEERLRKNPQWVTLDNEAKEEIERRRASTPLNAQLEAEAVQPRQSTPLMNAPSSRGTVVHLPKLLRRGSMLEKIGQTQIVSMGGSELAVPEVEEGAPPVVCRRRRGGLGVENEGTEEEGMQEGVPLTTYYRFLCSPAPVSREFGSPAEDPDELYKDFLRMLKAKQANQRRNAHGFTTNTSFEDMLEADQDERNRVVRLKELRDRFTIPSGMVSVYIARLDNLSIHEELFYDPSMDYAALVVTCAIGLRQKSSPVVWVRHGVRSEPVEHRLHFSIDISDRFASRGNFMQIALAAMIANSPAHVIGGIKLHVYELIKRKVIIKTIVLRTKRVTANLLVEMVFRYGSLGFGSSTTFGIPNTPIWVLKGAMDIGLFPRYPVAKERRYPGVELLICSLNGRPPHLRENPPALANFWPEEEAELPAEYLEDAIRKCGVAYGFYRDLGAHQGRLPRVIWLERYVSRWAEMRNLEKIQDGPPVTAYLRQGNETTDLEQVILPFLFHESNRQKIQENPQKLRAIVRWLRKMNLRKRDHPEGHLEGEVEKEEAEDDDEGTIESAHSTQRSTIAVSSSPPDTSRSAGVAGPSSLPLARGSISSIHQPKKGPSSPGSAGTNTPTRPGTPTHMSSIRRQSHGAAIRKSYHFVPDYTVTPVTDVTYLQIHRDQYNAARKATLLYEEYAKGGDVEDSRIESEVDKRDYNFPITKQRSPILIPNLNIPAKVTPSRLTQERPPVSHWKGTSSEESPLKGTEEEALLTMSNKRITSTSADESRGHHIGGMAVHSTSGLLGPMLKKADREQHTSGGSHNEATSDTPFLKGNEEKQEMQVLRGPVLRDVKVILGTDDEPSQSSTAPSTPSEVKSIPSDRSQSKRETNGDVVAGAVLSDGS